ncbi:uncharacterized protein KD926_011433 [Aspergillus affinis]|uniref:uncharacterized protein n=1 Tax=Aspergillus affinis TaxID=1070780 RepID=UPI0022FE891C|nr:uncharacterized protein KD926_011433 [Aspergillus affinis]KAI9038001.1 hypothetical protein KD926_011433 [Aspergillus affinis]
MDAAETDLRRRRPRVDPQDDDNLEENQAVLPLALNFHQYLLDKGELSTVSHLVTPPFRGKYLRHNFTLPAKSPMTPSARPRQTRSTRSSNNETEVCDKFNTTGCFWEGCGLGHTLAGILTYGAQIGYRGKKYTRYSTNHYIHEPVPKHDRGWRRIHNLSWPPGEGLNQGIPDSWSAIEYITIDDIYDQIIQTGPGCTITKRDIKDAFRIVPTAEDNQHLLAFQWYNSTYVECCLPFGLATAPFLFNLFAETLHWILQCLLPIFYINHYLDDFIAITQSPSMSDPVNFSDEVYNRVTDYLHIPRNTKKDEQGTCVTVLDIQLDSTTMEARLPPEKLCCATLNAAASLNVPSLSLKQEEQSYSPYIPSKPFSHVGEVRAAVSLTSQKAVKPDTALADLAALRAYHIDNFLEDKLFDNKHFRHLIDGTRRLNPITKVRVKKPISRDTITKLSAGLATLPLQPFEITANNLDDLNFAITCRVAFSGFLRFREFTYKTEDLSIRFIFLATKLTHSDVRFSSTFDYAQITFKRSKTDRRHEGVQIILAKTGNGACPVSAF